MKSFTANYAAEVARKRGAQPLWILSVTVSGIVYYLSDVVATIAGWNGGVTTLAWVSSWGELSEQVTGDLNEIRIADFSVTCLVDPDAAPDINALCAGDIEATPCRLWLWYRGLDAATDPPVCFFTGHVRDMAGDPYTVRLDLEDETYRLNGTIGIVATAELYPDMASGDVGKLLPIVFGSVDNLAMIALDPGPTITMMYDQYAGDTTIIVSDATHISPGNVILIDAELILVGTVSGNYLYSCTRGHLSTVAASHYKDTVVLRYQYPYVFAIDGPVAAISNITCELDFFPVPVDVTALATIYTGQAGDQLTGYGSLACVTFSGLFYLTNATGTHYLPPSKVRCNVTGLNTTPAEVAWELLSYAGYGAASVVGTVPTGYAINGAITTQGRLIDWLDSVAFQCRAFFRMVSGAGALYFRPDTLTSARTINTVAVDGGTPLLAWSRAPISQVINEITLRYGRDWQNTTGEPYLLTSAGTDAASITKYGKQTRDALFRCDFIAGSTMADSVQSFYLAQYSDRKTYVNITVFLDQLALEFGDVVTLPDGRVGMVVSVGIQPGSVDQMDRIKLTVMV